MLELGAILQLRQREHVLEHKTGTILEHQDQIIPVGQHLAFGWIEFETVGLTRHNLDDVALAGARSGNRDTGVRCLGHRSYPFMITDGRCPRGRRARSVNAFLIAWRIVEEFVTNFNKT